MNKKQILVSGLTTTTLLFGTTVAHAENDNDNQTEQRQNTNENESNQDNNQENGKDTVIELKEPVYAQGGSLNETQKQETRKLLGVSDDTSTYDVTVDDVREFMGTNYATIYSSALITPKKFAKGVDVDIVTPDNIQEITKAQYINAAITSGIQNAKIKIASVNEVTGEGALTGIYQALEREGFEVSKEDAQNANQEISDLSEINQQQKENGNDDYSDEAMNGAVADMKEQVADKKANNEDVTEDKVRQIVEDTLKEKGLDQQLNDSQKEKIVNIVINASNSQAMNNDPESFKKQSEKLKGKLSSALDDAKNKAEELQEKSDNNKDDKKDDKSAWDKFVDWVKGLFS